MMAARALPMMPPSYSWVHFCSVISARYFVESVLAAYASMIDINLSVDKWELNANVW